MNAIDLATDGWLKWTLLVLRFVGVAYIALGVCMGGVLLIPAMFVGSPDAPPELADQAIVYGVMAPFMLLFSIAIGVVNFVVASALAKRKPWAWIGALILGGIYAPSICLPFGAVILYALLRPGFKDAFDAAVAARA
jgi:hypothetical protein